MANCPGCEASVQIQNQQMNSVIEKAKQYAKDNEKAVAVYQEQGEWKFMHADIAIADRLPIKTIVSQYSAQ